jgi:hypothetical protein
MMQFLDGKKSYIIAAAAAVTAALQALGYTIPEWVYTAEMALFGISIRAAVSKVGL